MTMLNFDDVRIFVNMNIVKFHENKLNILKKMKLKKILKDKNPYLFKAKNVILATDFITQILDARLSASEEKLFGDFLEELAIFIASKTCGGRKSAATGIDLEFDRNQIRYIISIKSGTNWGNSAQQRKQAEDFQTAVKVLKQSNQMLNIQPVLGICYGKTRTSFLRGYMKVVGQNFWYLISENKNLFTEIIEPLGYKAKEHNDAFIEQKLRIINVFTREFINDFCNADGMINWKKVVEFNSGNLDLLK